MGIFFMARVRKPQLLKPFAIRIIFKKVPRLS
jgi:hypothetical protein